MLSTDCFKFNKKKRMFECFILFSKFFLYVKITYAANRTLLIWSIKHQHEQNAWNSKITQKYRLPFVRMNNNKI